MAPAEGRNFRRNTMFTAILAVFSAIKISVIKIISSGGVE